MDFLMAWMAHMKPLNGSKDNVMDLYKSGSALTLTSQVIPAFSDKTKALAASLEAEISDKDAEFFEAERLAAMRRAELEALRSKKEELRVLELEQSAGGAEYDELLREELEELERECEELTSNTESDKLLAVLDQERQRAANEIDDEISMDPEELLRTKLGLARELVASLHTREKLIKTIVQAAGLAGIDNQHEKYRYLLSGCLNMREEDVQEVLPDICEELQQYRELETKGA